MNELRAATELSHELLAQRLVEWFHMNKTIFGKKVKSRDWTFTDKNKIRNKRSKLSKMSNFENPSIRKRSRTHREVHDRMFYPFRIFKKWLKCSQKWDFLAVKRNNFSISCNLQMISTGTFQDTTGSRGGPQDCPRQNEGQNNFQKSVFQSRVTSESARR